MRGVATRKVRLPTVESLTECFWGTKKQIWEQLLTLLYPYRKILAVKMLCLLDFCFGEGKIEQGTGRRVAGPLSPLVRPTCLLRNRRCNCCVLSKVSGDNYDTVSSENKLIITIPLCCPSASSVRQPSAADSKYNNITSNAKFHSSHYWFNYNINFKTCCKPGLGCMHNR